MVTSIYRSLIILFFSQTLPIMLTLCLMLLATYYAYIMANFCFKTIGCNFRHSLDDKTINQMHCFKYSKLPCANNLPTSIASSLKG